MTLRDALTGLYARGAFDERYSLEIERSKNNNQSLSIMFMDLDHFKSVNDGFGHQRGDEVLQTFAQRLKDSVRYTDLLFRYGGDEFIIVLPETDKDTAVEVAERIIKKITGSPFPGDPPLSLSTSIGISSFPIDAQNGEELLLVADDRQYHAKRAGRGRAVSEDTFSPNQFSLEEPSRLIERDYQTELVKTFFENIEQKNTGVLQVSGPAGSGISRFLQVANESARLQGYAILNINGSASTRGRLFGSITESLHSWKSDPKYNSIAVDLPHPSQGTDGFIDSLFNGLSLQKFNGLVICIEDIPYVDRATRICLQNLIRPKENKNIKVALVYSIEDSGNNSPNVMFEAPVREKIELSPISQAGLRIWLRHSLQWEATDDFIAWFFQETEGLPRRIQYGLVNLIQNRQLILTKEGWHIAGRLEDYPLKDHLINQLLKIPDNLPGNLSDFIGREDDIQKLKSLLNENNLVTIIGPGGQGKTRLAIQTAAESMESFQNGVFYIDLSEVKSEQMLINSIEDILEIDSNEISDPQKIIIQFLENRSILLILDSYDSLINNTQVLIDILNNALNVKIIVTSRERLPISQSKVFELKGLDYPAEENIENIEGFSSVILYFQCAQRINPDFSQSEENNRYVIKICQLLGGNPLGIELSAAWIHTFTPKEIYYHISDNLSFILSNEYESPNSLLAILDSFWNYLFSMEQKVIEKLSIFNGGFRREAAGHIAGASPFFLDSLAHKSYLSRTENNRYQIHELLRQYSTDKLEEHPDDYLSTHQKHCDYYADFLKKRENDLKGPLQKQVLDDIYQEIGNIRLAWNWAIISKNIDFLSDTLDPLFMFYDMRSRFKEGEESFKLLDSLWLINEESIPSTFKAKAIARRGWFSFHLGKYHEAETLFDQSLSILENHQDNPDLLFSLNYRAAVAMHRGEYDKAKPLLEKSITLCERTGAIYECGIAHNILGRILHLQGNYLDAENQFHKSLTFSRQLNNHWSIAYTLEYLGEIAFVQNDYEKAKEYYTNCLEIRRGVMDKRGIAMALNSMGKTSQSLNEYNAANKFFNEALLMFTAIDNQIGVIQSQINIATNSTFLEEDDIALEIYILALRSATQIDAVPAQLKCLHGLSELFIRKNKIDFSLQILSAIRKHPLINSDLLSLTEDSISRLYENNPSLKNDDNNIQNEDINFESLIEILLSSSTLHLSGKDYSLAENR